MLAWVRTATTLITFGFSRNSALGEQILDVTKAERETEIEPDRPVNDLRREPISKVTDFRHALRLPSRGRRDNAVPTVPEAPMTRIVAALLLIGSSFLRWSFVLFPLWVLLLSIQILAGNLVRRAEV
jgi:hypothetical protein